MIRADRVGFEIDGHVLLEDITLDLAPGELVAVMGPNGAGKTTLLKILSGEWQASRGSMHYDWTEAERARRLAVLPQISFLNAPFTAMEVALMGRTPHFRPHFQNREQESDMAIARAALDLVEAGHLADSLYTQLSGGEQQSVQLARVLAQISDAGAERYLLLDEPTANLDIAHQHRVLALARRWSPDGTGVFAILHDLNLAAQYADRMILLESGRIAAQGPPEEVLQPEIILRVFKWPVTIMRHPGLGIPVVLSAG